MNSSLIITPRLIEELTSAYDSLLLHNHILKKLTSDQLQRIQEMFQLSPLSLDPVAVSSRIVQNNIQKLCIEHYVDQSVIESVKQCTSFTAINEKCFRNLSRKQIMYVMYKCNIPIVFDNKKNVAQRIFNTLHPISQTCELEELPFKKKQKLDNSSLTECSNHDFNRCTCYSVTMNSKMMCFDDCGCREPISQPQQHQQLDPIALLTREFYKLQDTVVKQQRIIDKLNRDVVQKTVNIEVRLFVEM